jgi:hypothetical protein
MWRRQMAFAALVMLAVACAPPPAVEPPLSTECDSAHVRNLVAQLFAGWTAHDAPSVIAQFGQSFQLEDRIAGNSTLIRDTGSLSDYLRVRFALGDVFSDVRADIPAHPSAAGANATAAFRRSFADKQLDGTAKLVCGDGHLTEVLIGSQ